MQHTGRACLANRATWLLMYCFQGHTMRGLAVAFVACAAAAAAASSACSHLNNCSGHGTCNTDTQTCACEDGWGSASDIALEKAPDCSQRAFASLCGGRETQE